MPGRPNKTLRLLVPLALALVGLGVPVAILAITTGSNKPQTSPGVVEASPESDPQTVEIEDGLAQAETASPVVPPSTDATSQGLPESATGDGDIQDQAETESGEGSAQATDQDDQPQLAAVEATGFRVETFAGDPLATGFTPIGGLGVDSPYAFQVEFSHMGAGVAAIRLARDFDSVKTDREALQGPVEPERHVAVQEQIARNDSILVPFAAVGLEVNNTFLSVLIGRGPDGTSAPVWRQVSAEQPGVFEAFVLDEAGERVFRLERRYSIEQSSHELLLRQSVENLTDRAMTVRWRQMGPVDLFASASYGGEKRRVRFGYLFDEVRDPGQQFVWATDFLWNRNKVAGRGSAKNYPDGVIWPNERSLERRYTLSWAGMTNRYFAAVAHPLFDASADTPDKSFASVERIERVRLWADESSPMAMLFHSPETQIGAAASASFDLGLYAGPLFEPVIRADSVRDRLNIAEVVVYNFGGPCAACTFEWLTAPLLGLLRFLHSITTDWALAIILLVVCVRTILHPVTRWSQTKMLVFGKQMQNMAPKQKILQERFKDDRQRMQQEMAKLWREEGVSPAGFLGCLPMLLQSPVWIALYASLFFLFDLRHEPAFFGVFQMASGNAWPFLADMAEPDRFIYFGVGPELPMVGKLDSLNILPILLGVVFYLQQKYLTPPTSGAMTPEQEMQQKMMKVMMVVMFPIIMYPAPSGLALYFITNSTLGIVESRWIRARAEKRGLLDEANLKKKPKKGGFMAKLQQLAQQQQELQAQRKAASSAPPSRKAEAPTPRRYKKR